MLFFDKRIGYPHLMMKLDLLAIEKNRKHHTNCWSFCDNYNLIQGVMFLLPNVFFLVGFKKFSCLFRTLYNMSNHLKIVFLTQRFSFWFKSKSKSKFDSFLKGLLFGNPLIYERTFCEFQKWNNHSLRNEKGARRRNGSFIIFLTIVLVFLTSLSLFPSTLLMLE